MLLKYQTHMQHSEKKILNPSKADLVNEYHALINKNKFQKIYMIYNYLSAIVEKRKVNLFWNWNSPTKKLIVILNKATGVGYLNAFLCGSCWLIGFGEQFFTSRSPSQLSPLLAVLA